MRFSERYGYKPIREIIQKDSINSELKIAIWNAYLDSIDQAGRFSDDFYVHMSNYTLYPLYKAYWALTFKKPWDEIPETLSDTSEIIRNYFFNKLEWYEIYDFIEITISNIPKTVNPKYKIGFIHSINEALEKEKSAYRIINEKVIEITSEQEIQSIEDALEKTDAYSGVQQHLKQALQLMSDRQNPDYRNSVKESISAVEALAMKLLDHDSITLGKAIHQLKNRYGLHHNLLGSLDKLYAYTCDEDGVRHGSPYTSTVSYSEAKFTLVACTNFINYLIEKTK